jgi:hypothetical protein
MGAFGGDLFWVVGVVGSVDLFCGAVTGNLERIGLGRGVGRCPGWRHHCHGKLMRHCAIIEG